MDTMTGFRHAMASTMLNPKPSRQVAGRAKDQTARVRPVQASTCTSGYAWVILIWLLIFGAMNMSHLVRTPIYGLIIVLTVGFWVLTSPLQARVQLDIIAKFRNADVELDVVTVIDSDVEASKSKVALLGIATPLRSSFSFRLAEWLLLIDLWSKAVKAQSDSWRVIGSMTETETSDVSHLTISAGPGVKFVISSSQKGIVTFILSKDDVGGFEKNRGFMRVPSGREAGGGDILRSEANVYEMERMDCDWLRGTRSLRGGCW